MVTLKTKLMLARLLNIVLSILPSSIFVHTLFPVLIFPPQVLAEFKKGAIQDNAPMISSTLSPDRKTVSILFSNLLTQVTSQQRGPAISTRDMSFRLPIDGTEKTLRFMVHVRGFALCESGTSIQGLVRLAGSTKLLQLSDSCKEGKGFFESFEVALVAGSDLQGTIHIIAERSEINARKEAQVSIDSIEIIQLATVPK